MKMTKTIAKMKEQGMYERIHSFVKDKIQEGMTHRNTRKNLNQSLSLNLFLNTVV